MNFEWFSWDEHTHLEVSCNENIALGLAVTKTGEIDTSVNQPRFCIFHRIDNPTGQDCLITLNVMIKPRDPTRIMLSNRQWLGELYLEYCTPIQDYCADGLPIESSQAGRGIVVTFFVPAVITSFIVGYRGGVANLDFRLEYCGSEFLKQVEPTRTSSYLSPTNLQSFYAPYLDATGWFPETFILKLHDACQVMYNYALKTGGSGLDLGCNKGIHVAGMLDILKGKSGRVVGVDGNPHMIELASIAIGMNDQCQLINFACIAEPSEKSDISFYVSDEYSELGSIISDYIANNFYSIDGKGFVEITIPCLTVDQIITQYDLYDLRFVKIDIEGLDLFVMANADLLYESRPVIYFEFSSSQGLGLSIYVFNKLRSLGYRIFDIFMNELSCFTFLHPEIAPIDRIALPSHYQESDIELLRHQLHRVFEKPKKIGRILADVVIDSVPLSETIRIVISEHILGENTFDILVEFPGNIFQYPLISENISIRFSHPNSLDYFYVFSLPSNRQVPVNGGRKILFVAEFEEHVGETLDVSLYVSDKCIANLKFNVGSTDFFEWVAELKITHTDEDIKIKEISANNLNTSYQQAKLVYLTGTIKSGTTWLENIVKQHPDVFILHEGNTFFNFFDWSATLEKIKTDYHPPSYVGWLSAKLSIKKWLTFMQVSISRKALSHYGSLWNGKVIADRTPGNANLIASIFETDTNALMVQIVRNPLDVVVSAMFHDRAIAKSSSKQGSFPSWIHELLDEKIESSSEGVLRLNVEFVEEGGFDWIIDMWLNDQNNLVKLVDIYPERVLILRYEDLLDKPKDNIRQIFKFIGIELTETEHKNIVEQSHFTKFSGGRENGTMDASSFYRNGCAGNYTNYFSGKVVDAILERCGELPRRFGYQI